MKPRQKFARAKAVSDKVFDCYLVARQHLGHFTVDGCGVMTDPGSVRADLLGAALEIDKALKELAGFTDWPTLADYGD
jgi:hypothetical protein